jgi:hypothetical protein
LKIPPLKVACAATPVLFKPPNTIELSVLKSPIPDSVVKVRDRVEPEIAYVPVTLAGFAGKEAPGEPGAPAFTRHPDKVKLGDLNLIVPTVEATLPS